MIDSGRQTVAAVSCACERPSCGKSLPPRARRRGEPRRYCSDSCRRMHWEAMHPRQRTLPLSPPAAPVPPVRDGRVSVADQPRLRGHNLRVLDRLREGPATNAELAALLGPASAWRTRVSDVRLWLERHEGMTVKATRCLADGLYLYRLEAL